MADYYTQQVVQQTIPSSLISPFEKLLLGEMLEHEQIEDETYYFASEQVCDFPSLPRTGLQEALATSPQPSRLRAFAEKAFAESCPEDSYVDLDLSACEFSSDAHLVILQDIVRRAKGLLPYVTIAGSYTCSKMRDDGFGGMCIVITPRAIRYWSTCQVLERFTAQFEKRQAAKRAPPAPPPERESVPQGAKFHRKRELLPQPPRPAFTGGPFQFWRPVTMKLLTKQLREKLLAEGNAMIRCFSGIGFMLPTRYRRWRCALAFATGRLSCGDAQHIILHCQYLAGWYELLTITSDGVLERAQVFYGDRAQALKPYLPAACSYAAGKWDDPDSYDCALDFALEKACEDAAGDGIEIDENEDGQDGQSTGNNASGALEKVMP